MVRLIFRDTKELLIWVADHWKTGRFSAYYSESTGEIGILPETSSDPWSNTFCVCRSTPGEWEIFSSEVSVIGMKTYVVRKIDWDTRKDYSAERKIPTPSNITPATSSLTAF